MANKIDTLHLRGDLETNLYPNIVADNIPDGAVTPAKLSESYTLTSTFDTSISDLSNKIAAKQDKLTTGSITSDLIADSSITSAKLADSYTLISTFENTITDVSNKIAAKQDKLTTGSITTDLIADSSITPAKLDTSANYEVNNLTASNVYGNTLTVYSTTNLNGTVNMSSPSVSGVMSISGLNSPATMSIGASKGINFTIGSGTSYNTITLQDKSGTVALLSDITATEIKDGSVTTAKLANGAVTGSKILSTTNITCSILTANNKITCGSNDIEAPGVLSASALSLTGYGGITLTPASGVSVKVPEKSGTIALLSDISGDTEIKDGSVTTAKLAEAAVTAAKIDPAINLTTTGQITGKNIVASNNLDVTGTIKTTKLTVSDTVTMKDIKTNTITATGVSGDNSITITGDDVNFNVAGSAVTLQKKAGTVALLSDISGGGGGGLSYSYDYFAAASGGSDTMSHDFTTEAVGFTTDTSNTTRIRLYVDGVSVINSYNTSSTLREYKAVVLKDSSGTAYGVWYSNKIYLGSTFKLEISSTSPTADISSFMRYC